MSAVATNRHHGTTAATELLVLDPVAQRLGLSPIVLSAGEITLGSASDCAVRLDVAGVQPLHCVLQNTRQRISVRALDHRTWHNNLPITEGWLKSGDRLAIGPVEFRVRQAEPWDILPLPETPAVGQTALGHPGGLSSDTTTVDQINDLEARLRLQIAQLESQMSRHQAALDELDQPLQGAVDNDTRPADSSKSFSADPSQAVTTPKFHLRTPLSESSQHYPESLDADRLQAELQAQQRQARQQLAELAVRHDSLDRQCRELEAQWDHLRELIAEQEAATIERSQREQQLYERERRCSFKESDLTQRLQKLQLDQDALTARNVHAQTTADELQQRTADLLQRQVELENGAQQLTLRESQLEQLCLDQARQQDDLAQREAALKASVEAADTNVATWNDLRQETECRWAQRAQELETQAALQLVRADELTQREHAADQLANSLRQEQERQLAERTRLEAVQHDLLQREVQLTEQQRALELLHSQWLSRDEELARRETAHQQALTEIQSERDELNAERIRLAALGLELSLTESHLAEQQQSVSAQADSLTAQATELQLRQQSLEQVGAHLWQEQEDLDLQRRRLDQWQSELEVRESNLLEEQQQLAQQVDRLQSEAAALKHRDFELEQRTVDLQRNQAALIAERNHLTTWTEILSAQQAELSVTQREVESHSLQLQSQAAEIQQQAESLRQQAAAVQREREDLQVGLDRFAAWNEELTARQADLARQQSELAQQQHSLSVQSERTSCLMTELLEREKRTAEDLAVLEKQQRELAAEHQRLAAWNDELQNQRSEIQTRLIELKQQQSEWEQNRRIEASASAAAMTSEYGQLARVREDLTLAERELERVEADLLAFERELQNREQGLLARESTLIEAETECAWQSRAAEIAAEQHNQNSPSFAVDADREEQQLACLRNAHDALAIDLFATTQYLESENNLAVDHSEQLRSEAERLRHNVEIWQQQTRALQADQMALEASRQELQRQQSHWEQELQSRQLDWTEQQRQLAEQTEQLRIREVQLQAHEAAWSAEQTRLEAAQQELDAQAQSLAIQQSQLQEQSALLEQQQRELAKLQEQQARQLAEATTTLERGTEQDRQLEAARIALRREQAQLEAAQLELDRERLAWEQERQSWRDNLVADTSRFDTDPSTPALETLTQLEDLVQDELDRDHTAEGFSDDVLDDDRSLDLLENARRQYQSQHTDEELGSDARAFLAENDSSTPELPRSLWSTERSTDEQMERPNVSELPKTEEDLSVLDLRARLAEMFNLELNDSDTTAVRSGFESESDAPASAAETPDLTSYATQPAADELEFDRDSSRSNLTAAVETHLTRPEPIVTEPATEPSIDEYDSVESYMARLLDRNRRSRAGEEPLPERHVSSHSTTPRTDRHSSTTSQTLHEFDDSVPEPVPAAPEPEVVDSVPTLRQPVDTHKIRAGLDSLRQVANISARHAIARSKWKRMRTKVALQSLLTAGSFVVGLSSLTGNWLGFIGTSVWGWLAIAMGTALALKLGLDFRWIFYGDHHARRGDDFAAGTFVEPTAPFDADLMPDDPESLGS